MSKDRRIGLDIYTEQKDGGYNVWLKHFPSVEQTAANKEEAKQRLGKRFGDLMFDFEVYLKDKGLKYILAVSLDHRVTDSGYYIYYVRGFEDIDSVDRNRWIARRRLVRRVKKLVKMIGKANRLRSRYVR